MTFMDVTKRHRRAHPYTGSPYLDVSSVNVKPPCALVQTYGGLFAGFHGKCVVHESSKDGALSYAVFPTQYDLVIRRSRRHC